MERVEKLLGTMVSRRRLLHAAVIGVVGGAIGLEMRRKSKEERKKQLNTPQESKPER